jgi:hypothetical protein
MSLRSHTSRVEVAIGRVEADQIRVQMSWVGSSFRSNTIDFFSSLESFWVRPGQVSDFYEFRSFGVSSHSSPGRVNQVIRYRVVSDFELFRVGSVSFCHVLFWDGSDFRSGWISGR